MLRPSQSALALPDATQERSKNPGKRSLHSNYLLLHVLHIGWQKSFSISYRNIPEIGLLYWSQAPVGYPGGHRVQRGGRHEGRGDLHLKSHDGQFIGSHC